MSDLFAYPARTIRQTSPHEFDNEDASEPVNLLRRKLECNVQRENKRVCAYQDEVFVVKHEGLRQVYGRM